VELPVLEAWLSEDAAPLSIGNPLDVKTTSAGRVNDVLNSHIIALSFKRNEKYELYVEM
jgi:hypothetical protein